MQRIGLLGLWQFRGWILGWRRRSDEESGQDYSTQDLEWAGGAGGPVGRRVDSGVDLPSECPQPIEEDDDHAGDQRYVADEDDHTESVSRYRQDGHLAAGFLPVAALVEVEPSI